MLGPALPRSVPARQLPLQISVMQRQHLQTWLQLSPCAQQGRRTAGRWTAEAAHTGQAPVLVAYVAQQVAHHAVQLSVHRAGLVLDAVFDSCHRDSTLAAALCLQSGAAGAEHEPRGAPPAGGSACHGRRHCGGAGAAAVGHQASLSSLRHVSDAGSQPGHLHMAEAPQIQASSLSQAGSFRCQLQSTMQRRPDCMTCQQCHSP